MRNVIGCQAGALFVDTLLSPTPDPNLDYSERGIFRVHRAPGHFADGHLGVVLFDVASSTFFSFRVRAATSAGAQHGEEADGVPDGAQ